MLRTTGCLTLLCATTILVVACSSTSATSTPGSVDASAPDAGSTAIDPTPDELSTRGTCPAVTGTGTEHQGRISADETWSAAGGPHHVTADLQILATVTLEPCTLVLVDTGVQISVGTSTDAGSIVGHGSAELVAGVRDVRPVTFEASDTTAPWAQLDVEAKGTLDLSIAAIQHGGAVTTGERGALLVRGVTGGTNDGPITPSTKVDRVLVEKSSSYGVNLEAWGAFATGSDNLWIRNGGSADFPSAIRLEPGVAATLPTGLTASGNVKDEILLLTSKTFQRDDTLVNRGIPYRQHGAMYVNGSTDGAPVTLTIEAGVTLGFDDDAGTGMFIGSSDTRQGILVAVGTPSAPIVFTSGKTTKAPGDWLSLYFKSTPKTGSKISYAHIEYAGGPSTTTGFGCGPSDNTSAVLILGTGVATGGPSSSFIDNTTFDNIGGSSVIVSGWIDDNGPDFATGNTFGASVGGCHVSKPRRTGAGDVCDGNRTTCW